MFDIQVFAKERDAGLERLIRSTAALAYHRPVNLVAPSAVSDQTKLAGAEWAKATNQGQVDLHYLSTVLVTTGWNLNDDVFDQVETYLARATPEDKPFNYEHDCADIIGHITASRLIDGELAPIALDIEMASLPAKFHIETGAVLYKVWSKPELQERMDTMLEEIAQGEWFVSMEALFHGFDYGVQSTDGIQRVVARNEQTAFLTKYLRAYGGTGQYEDYRIGRVLRSIVFSGKGLVRKPANPESVILDDPRIFDSRAFAAVSENISKNIFENSGLLKIAGYSESTSGSADTPRQMTDSTISEQNQMSDTSTLEQTVADQKAEIARLTNSATEVAQAALKAELETYKTENTGLKASVAGLTAEKGKLVIDLAANEIKLTEVTSAHKTASEELASLKATAKRTERIQTIATQLKTTVEAATKMADTTQALSDEQFAAHVELMVTTLAQMTPATTVVTETVETTDEVDAGEVDETVLEDVVPEPASAGLASGDAGAVTVQSAIAAFFTKPAK